jgi:hypothetical protein
VLQVGATKRIDFGGRPAGYPEYDKTDKQSLEFVLRRMTSSEYNDELRDNPEFRAAVKKAFDE